MKTKTTYDGYSATTQEIHDMKKDLNSWLEDYMDDHVDYWNETSDEDELPNFKVRVDWALEPDYFKYTFGYDKYYMNWVNGNYEYSLENMIFMAMMNMGYYEKLLHPDDYKEAVKVATDFPDSIYGINIWNEEDDAYKKYAEEVNEIISEILYGAVQFVGEKLCLEYGLEAVEKFENLECQEEDEA